MKKILGIMLVFFLTAGLVYAKGLDITKQAGEYSVSIKMDKPPSVGRNDLDIGIQDAKGAGITDATVAVDYGMPAMPGMPAMNYKTKAELAGKKYKAVLDLSMSGSWTVNVKITKGGKTQSVKLTVDAR